LDLVAVTRQLTVPEVEAAYRRGIFPMHDVESGLITWHRPARRAVLPLGEFHVSRSLAHTLKQARFICTYNQDFAGVMDACSEREGPTWISDEFKQVYGELHRRGRAHSVEIWVDGQ
jgi:leucyl/phenylalanyl-tRNA--protein transferase